MRNTIQGQGAHRLGPMVKLANRYCTELRRRSNSTGVSAHLRSSIGCHGYPRIRESGVVMEVRFLPTYPLLNGVAMDRLFPFFWQGEPESNAQFVRALLIAVLVNGAMLAFYTLCIACAVRVVFP